jgi:DUF4097 and DUF4098 domain-containing protein YvlB
MNAAGPVDLKVTSGDITTKLSAANKVKAQTTSGDVHVIVPPGRYNVSTNTGSGDAMVVGVQNDLTATNTIEVRTASGDASVSAMP